MGHDNSRACPSGSFLYSQLDPASCDGRRLIYAQLDLAACYKWKHLYLNRNLEIALLEPQCAQHTERESMLLNIKESLATTFAGGGGEQGRTPVVMVEPTIQWKPIS